MNILDLAKGKKMMVDTDMGVMVELEIKEIKEENHSRNLEAATAANDWWPASESWKTYRVYFTNGKSKEFATLSKINFY